MNQFARLVTTLLENNVKDIEAFKEAVKAAEAGGELIKDGAWRSAKSVMKKAIQAGIEYDGLGKSKIEALIRTISRQ